MKSITCKNSAHYLCVLLISLLMILNDSIQAQTQEGSNIDIKNIQIHFLNVTGNYIQETMHCMPQIYRYIIMQDGKAKTCVQDLPKYVYQEVLEATASQENAAYQGIQLLWNQLVEVDEKWQEFMRYASIYSKNEMLNNYEAILKDYEHYQVLHENLVKEIYGQASLARKGNEALEMGEEEMRAYLAHEKRLLEGLSFQVNDKPTDLDAFMGLQNHILLGQQIIDGFSAGANLPYANGKFWEQFRATSKERLKLQMQILELQRRNRYFSAFDLNQLYQKLLIQYNDKLVRNFYDYVTYAARLSDYHTLYEPVVIPNFELMPDEVDFLTTKHVDIQESNDRDGAFNARSLNQPIEQTLDQCIRYVNLAIEENNLLRQRLESRSAYSQNSRKYHLAKSEYEHSKRMCMSHPKLQAFDTQKWLKESWEYLVRIEHLSRQFDADYTEAIRVEHEFFDLFFAFEHAKESLIKGLKEIYEQETEQSINFSRQAILSMRLIEQAYLCLSYSSSEAEKWSSLEQFENILDELDVAVEKNVGTNALADYLFQARNFARVCQTDHTTYAVSASFNQLAKVFNEYVQQQQLPLFPQAYVSLSRE